MQNILKYLELKKKYTPKILLANFFNFFYFLYITILLNLSISASFWLNGLKVILILNFNTETFLGYTYIFTNYCLRFFRRLI